MELQLTLVQKKKLTLTLIFRENIQNSLFLSLYLKFPSFPFNLKKFNLFGKIIKNRKKIKKMTRIMLY